METKVSILTYGKTECYNSIVLIYEL